MDAAFRRSRVRFGVLAFLASLILPGSGQPQQPRPSGITEKATITLQLLDVEVLDEEGRPLRGLSSKDFVLWIDGKRSEIRSVDDLCGCADPEVESSAGDAPSPPVDPDTTPASQARTSSVPEPPRYVLYFDFSQLQLDGRDHAFVEAKRWVRDAKPAEAEVMVAGYHSVRGTEELCPWTRSKQALLEALDQARENRLLLDPFPANFATRVTSCPECLSRSRRVMCVDECFANPRREYDHARRSYLALARFLERLYGMPGRKALVVFQQNFTTFPSRYYPLLGNSEVGDHILLLDEVASEATLARTELYPVFVGSNLDSHSPTSQAENVGVNLADFSGGKAGRTRVPDEFVRQCTCTYRIGFAPPEVGRRPHRIRVEAAGRTVPYRYRMRFVDDVSHWWRVARAVLQNPSAATDVGVAVAVFPVRRDGGRWTISAQVSLDVESLTLIPEGGGLQGGWEVGGLLRRDNSEATWEVLGVSQVHLASLGGQVAAVLHERTFERVRPGTYHWGAFVRDRTANLFGGGEATLELPPPGSSQLVGPFLVAADRSRWSADLPLRSERAKGEKKKGQVTSGELPLAPGALAKQRLLFLSWICPEESAKPPQRLVRFVARGDQPLFRFESPNLVPAGDCYRLADPVRATALDAGPHTYHLRWTPGPDDPPMEKTLEFYVAPD